MKYFNSLFVSAAIALMINNASACETSPSGRTETGPSTIYEIEAKLGKKCTRSFDLDVNAGYKTISISEFTHSEGLHAVSRQVDPVTVEIEFTGKTAGQYEIKFYLQWVNAQSKVGGRWYEYKVKIVK